MKVEIDKDGNLKVTVKNLLEQFKSMSKDDQKKLANMILELSFDGVSFIKGSEEEA